MYSINRKTADDRGIRGSRGGRYYLLLHFTRISNKQGAPLANDRIKLFRKNIFGDRLNALRTLLPEKTALREDIAEEYQTSDENVQNYIIATQNFGPEIEDAIEGIFSKPSNRGPSNIAARTTILRHESDLLKDREDDSLKYGRTPIELLLSKKKKFFATNPILHKQLTEVEQKKKSLDESMLKFYQNFNNNNNFQQQNAFKNFFTRLFQGSRPPPPVSPPTPTAANFPLLPPPPPDNNDNVINTTNVDRNGTMTATQQQQGCLDARYDLAAGCLDTRQIITAAVATNEI